MIRSVAGDKNVKAEPIDNFIPIRPILDDDDPIIQIAKFLGKETANIYLDRSKNIPSHIDRAFKDNEQLIDAIKYLRR